MLFIWYKNKQLIFSNPAFLKLMAVNYVDLIQYYIVQKQSTKFERKFRYD